MMLFVSKFIKHYSRFIHQLEHVVQKILPPCCLLCGGFSLRAENLCEACHHDLPILSQYCVQCAQILTYPTKVSALYCGKCLIKPPAFDLTYALFPYKPPIIQLITQLKFQGKLNCAKLLGHLLLDKIQTNWYHNKPLPDLILPMPLHPIRLRERGFNQALEIARPIAKKLQIQIDLQGTERIKYTWPQSHLLSANERKSNLSNAFQAIGNYSGLTVAIVDDVMTTGFTVYACAKALKQKGAKNIHVWCCARR